MKWINIVNISKQNDISLLFTKDLQYISIKIHSEQKVVSATRNLRTNSTSIMYYKVVITTSNTNYENVVI